MTVIDTEDHFHSWIVDYLHRKGPIEFYPQCLIDAAEMALQTVPGGVSPKEELEMLRELIPKAKDLIQHPLAVGHILWPVFSLARYTVNPRPYSRSVMNFLAACLTPPVVEAAEDAARVGFEIAGLHRTGCFVEYRKKRCLHLETTPRGHRDLGIAVHLRYEPNSPFFSSSMIEEAGRERDADQAFQMRLLQLRKKPEHRRRRQ